MPIEILGQADQGDVEDALRTAILEGVPDAEVEVMPGGPGHFGLRVKSPAFAGLARVKQQQLVYGAIAHLMSGSSAPVHAIDRLECVVPA